MNKASESRTKYLREVAVSYNRTKHELPTEKVSESKQVADYLRANVFDPNTLEYQESFCVIFLNRNNKIIGYHTLSVGGMAGTIVDPKILFTLCFLTGASGIILSHNHPSGNTKPSDADVTLTSKVKKGADLLDITILDHIILTADSYYSFADNGLL